jgi:hypothetical protein
MRSPFVGQSLSVIGMWGQVLERARCNSKQARFHNAETLCEEEELKYSKYKRKYRI